MGFLNNVLKKVKGPDAGGEKTKEEDAKQENGKDGDVSAVDEENPATKQEDGSGGQENKKQKHLNLDSVKVNVKDALKNVKENLHKDAEVLGNAAKKLRKDSFMQTGEYYNPVCKGSTEVPPADSSVAKNLGKHEKALAVPTMIPLFEAIMTGVVGITATEIILLGVLVAQARASAENQSVVPLYIFLCSVLIMFIAGIFKVLEKRLREVFYYKAMRHGILLDFWNPKEEDLPEDEPFFAKAKRETVKFFTTVNLGTIVLALIIGCATYMQITAAIESEEAWAYVAVLFSVGICAGQANKMRKPFDDVDKLETMLITVNKFVEPGANESRDLLGRLKVQSEDVTFRRLSDIINLQREAHFQMACKPFAEKYGFPLGDYDELKYGLNVRHRRLGRGPYYIGDWGKLAKRVAELDALKEETLKRDDFPHFGWNQLVTTHEEHFTFDETPALAVCSWANGHPQFETTSVVVGSIRNAMTGRYIQAFRKLDFQDEEDKKIAKDHEKKYRIVLFLAAFIFMGLVARAIITANDLKGQCTSSLEKTNQMCQTNIADTDLPSFRPSPPTG
ncbi:hypothetical protein RI054_01g00280 [Pseudoscourfieldia marina]